MIKKEESLQLQVCTYLKIQFPKTIFTCDLSSGMKLRIGQAIKASKMRSSRGLPDLFIAQKSFQGEYSGLFLELKKEGTRLHNKIGGWATPHIAEQYEILHRLRKLGYKAEFACGWGEAKKIIDQYL